MITLLKPNLYYIKDEKDKVDGFYWEGFDDDEIGIYEGPYKTQKEAEDVLAEYFRMTFY